jgi:hypothetical protein
VKVLPLFKSQEKFEPMVGKQKLEMEDILVYYVDEEPPTFTMKALTGGIIAVIVVVVLAVIAGLLVVVSVMRKPKCNLCACVGARFDVHFFRVFCYSSLPGGENSRNTPRLRCVFTFDFYANIKFEWKMMLCLVCPGRCRAFMLVCFILMASAFCVAAQGVGSHVRWD